LFAQADVVVVAHGMGARLVIEAVGGEAGPPMAAVASPRALRFVFVAPDVRSETFKQRLARFPAGTLRTMYCNSNDQVWAVIDSARGSSSAAFLAFQTLQTPEERIRSCLHAHAVCPPAGP